MREYITDVICQGWKYLEHMLEGECISFIIFKHLDTLKSAFIKRASILINSRPKDYPPACGSVSAKARRLCPCVDLAATNQSESLISPQAVNRRVTAALETSLTALEAKLVADGAHNVPVVLGREEYYQAFPPQNLLQELRAKSVIFVRARLGQSCLQACSTRRFVACCLLCAKWRG